MLDPILSARNLVKHYDGIVATDNFSFDLAPGELCAIIGPNGAGKTTLLAQLSGELQPNAGQILYLGQDVTRLSVHQRAGLGFGRSFQITSVFADFTALQNVVLAVQAQVGHSFRFWQDASTDVQLVEPALGYLNEVGLASRANALVSSLSHGEKRALEIAIALAGKPQLLLLDEPMAGMGIEESENMISLLLSLKGRISIVLIEHDMDAVFKLADRIIVLVSGACIASGDAEAIRLNPEVRKAYLGEGETTC